jgi:hypothetical protein
MLGGMGLEAFIIAAIQFAISLWRAALDGFGWRHRSAGARLQHILSMKEEVDRHLWKVLAETNGDAIIRELRRMDSYPEVDESLRSTSPWFKVELKGTYHAGIEVFLSIEEVRIRDGVARPTTGTDPEAEPVLVVGRIPYLTIEGIDWKGDEFYGFTHIYCRFRPGWGRGPYESIVLYEVERLELMGRPFWRRIEDVRWKPRRRSLPGRWRDRRELRKQDAEDE